MQGRQRVIKIKPGYDGVYGQPILTDKITNRVEKENKKVNGIKQEGLDKFF